MVVVALVPVAVALVVVVLEKEVENRDRTQEQESSGDLESRLGRHRCNLSRDVGVDATAPPEKNSGRFSHVMERWRRRRREREKEEIRSDKSRVFSFGTRESDETTVRSRE